MGLCELEEDRHRLAEELPDVNGVGDKLGDPELQYVLVTEALTDGEREGERVGVFV